MLAVMERAVMQRMLEVSLCDHIDSQTLRQVNFVKDIVVATREEMAARN